MKFYARVFGNGKTLFNEFVGEAETLDEGAELVRTHTQHTPRRGVDGRWVVGRRAGEDGIGFLIDGRTLDERNAAREALVEGSRQYAD